MIVEKLPALHGEHEEAPEVCVCVCMRFHAENIAHTHPCVCV
jgi:hypothetical protein